jgi:hypothetical protein
MLTNIWLGTIVFMLFAQPLIDVTFTENVAKKFQVHGNKIVQQIELYESEKGEYPSEIEELIPSHIQKKDLILKHLGMKYEASYNFSAKKKEFRLLYNFHLDFLDARSWLSFAYYSLQPQNTHKHRKIKRRYGNWIFQKSYRNYHHDDKKNTDNISNLESHSFLGEFKNVEIGDYYHAYFKLDSGVEKLFYLNDDDVIAKVMNLIPGQKVKLTSFKEDMYFHEIDKSKEIEVINKIVILI